MSRFPPPRRARLWSSVQALALDTTPLRESHDFRFLFAGQAVGVIGNQVSLVAIPYLVYQITNSSLMVGLVSFAQFVPALVFALWGGALADVMDRRTLLRVTQVLVVITTALLAVPALLGTPPLWYIFLLVGATAGVQSINSPTRRAAIPRIVGMDQVANALAFDQITFQLGSVLGPAVAGLLIARINIGPTLAINTGAAVFSLATLLFVAPMPPAPQAAGAKRGLAAIREGLVYLKDKPVILSTFLIDLNATFFGGPQALFPALATQVFRVGPTGLGLLYAAPGIGAFVGALMTGWVGRVRHQGRAIVIAVCIWGAAIAAFGFMTRLFWLGLILLAIAGMADMFSAVFRATIVQIATPDRLRGRLSAVHFIAVSSGPRLGDVEAGTVASLASTQFSVVSGGLAAIIGAIIVVFAIPTFMRFDAQEAIEHPT